MDNETAGYSITQIPVYQQSDSLFDITSGILRRTSGFKSGAIPAQEAIASLLEKIGWHKINWQRPLLAFTVPGMGIDFGGVVKECRRSRRFVMPGCWD